VPAVIVYSVLVAYTDEDTGFDIIFKTVVVYFVVMVFLLLNQD